MNVGDAKAGAKVVQDRLPRRAPELQVEVENLRLPDGMVLGVVLNGQIVGTLNVALGAARLNTTPAGAIEPNALIAITRNGVPILANASRWKPRRRGLESNAPRGGRGPRGS